MLLRILRKDLTKRKGVNLILFLFITMATLFLASSVNNILVVSSAVDYYISYANIADVNIIMDGESEKTQMDEWLESNKKLVKEFDHNHLINLSRKTTSIIKNGKEISLNMKGANLFLGTQDIDYCKVYDNNGKPFTLKKGEIAVSNSFVGNNPVKVNDRISIRIGSEKKEFIIKVIMKDAMFGNDTIGMTRLILGQEDYDHYEGKADKTSLYYVMTGDAEKFTEELNRQEFSMVHNALSRDIYNMVYSFDMVMAALLILIGICLILIALLVLRFTLVFTMEEDYQEIGIMKAVGFRDFAIKRIYLVKYLVIVCAGAILGLLLSIPAGSIMIRSVSLNMIMEESTMNFGFNIVCACVVVILVMLFCYFSTRKLNKVSAITAIRGGQSGERFNKRTGIRLHRQGRMRVFVFLGLNDIVSHVKRYGILIVTFCISFILITIPLNTINTMNSEEMALKFLLDTKSAVCVSQIEGNGEKDLKNTGELKENMDRVTLELKRKGYDAALTGIPIFFLKYSGIGEKEKFSIMSVTWLGENTDYPEYDEGEAPSLSNEIAFSRTILDERGWEIGDSVETIINGKKKEFIITGSYSDYMQLGKSARISPAAEMGQERMFDYLNILVDMDTEKTPDELAVELKKELPGYEWSSVQAFVNKNIGGIQETLDQLLLPMTAMLCFVIMLITLLMEKLFIVREKGEIAMIKSVGFRNKTIRNWQVMRMVWVAAISMVIAVPLSLISNRWMLKPIFAIMGADVKIQIVPWLVYGLYPAVLFAGIIAATVFATRSVRKIDIRGLNHLE